MMFLTDDSVPIHEVMTKDRLVTGGPDTTLENAEAILNQNKVEKLLLVDGDRRLRGLITMRDISKLHQYPAACRDARESSGALPSTLDAPATRFRRHATALLL